MSSEHFDEPSLLHETPSEETPASPQEETPAIKEDTALPVIEEQSVLPEAEASLPPEAQGETNGGPLGCCLGTVVGLLLTSLLITSLSLLLANGGYLGVATLPSTLLGAGIGGYFGWRIGKRIYKEYEPPVVKRRGRKLAATKRKSKKVRSRNLEN